MSMLGDIGKKPYQSYTIEHGIERVRVQIPLREIRAFEAAFNEALQEDKVPMATLLDVVKAHGGKLRKVK